MIVDTSAVIAVLRRESGWEEIDRLLTDAASPRMSAGSYLELGIVVDRGADPALSRNLDRLLAAWGVTIEPVSVEHTRLARAAHRDYGGGSGHRARLNFGDCFAYALASQTGEPLLFVGDDFAQTDLPAARR